MTPSTRKPIIVHLASPNPLAPVACHAHRPRAGRPLAAYLATDPARRCRRCEGHAAAQADRALRGLALGLVALAGGAL